LVPAGPLQQDLGARGVPTFALDCCRRKQYLGAIFRLSSWLKRSQIDVLQTHLLEASLVGLAAGRLVRTPLTVFTGHHSHEVPLQRKKRLLWVDCLCSRWLAHRIIAPSAHMKEIFVESEGIAGERIAVIPHGLDYRQWDPKPGACERIRAEFGLEGKIIFGTVGRLYWIKDYACLLKAFTPLAKQTPDLAILLVGEGGDRQPLTQLAAELGISDRVRFAGYRDDVADLLAAIDVFVHPALAESFGLVILEAMALGKPVVATPVGISRDIIEEGVNGLLFPPSDPEALRNALAHILQERTRWPQMGQAGRKLARTFTAAKMVAAYEQQYLRWLAERGKPVTALGDNLPSETGEPIASRVG
jgi:glycosyltransferase involved in cell wall biosynthesis